METEFMYVFWGGFNVKLMSVCYHFSQKNQWHARAYIDFKSPEDVVEFAEFFDGRVFVNEKGNNPW